MSTQDLILQWAIATCIGTVLSLRRRMTLFHPEALYLAFHVLAFCVRPTLLAAFDLEAVWKSMLFAPEPENMRMALWVSSAGLAAFCTGSILASLRSAALKAAEPPEMDRNDHRALLVTSTITVPIGLIAFVAAVRSNEISGYVADLIWIMLPASLLAILAARWRWWGLLPLALVATARGTVGAPALVVVSALLLAILIHLWSHQRRQPSIALLAVCAVGATCTLLLSGERTALRAWLGGSEAPVMTGTPGFALAEQLDRRGFAHFDALTYVVATVPEKSGIYSHGEQHVARLRSVFGDASASPTRDHRQFGQIDLDRFGRFRDLPIALATDGWISGGWYGVLFTLGLAGLIFGAAFSWFSHRQDDPAAACFYLSVQALALGSYCTGGLEIVFSAMLVAAPLWLWRILGRRFRAADTAAANRERLREERQRRRLLGTALLNPHAAPLPPEVLATPSVDDPDSDETGDDGASPDRQAASPPIGTTDPQQTPPARPTARWRENPPR